MDDDHTRLVESLEGGLEGHAGIVVLDPDLRPGRIPNERKMLRGIKKRAERAAIESPSSHNLDRAGEPFGWVPPGPNGLAPATGMLVLTNK